MSSTTISTSLPRTTWKASATTRALFFTSDLAFRTSLSATCVILIARPARRRISSALRLSTSQVPPPTVPMPSRPTLIGFMLPQPELEMAPDVGPFARQHAVHHRVAHRAVAPRPVVADHAVLLRAQRLDGALRPEIEVVGAQPDHLALQLVEGVGKKQQLARGIDVAALRALRVPGPADLHPVGRGDDVVVARAADQRAAFQLAHRPRQHLAFALALQRGIYVGGRLLGLRHRG